MRAKVVPPDEASTLQLYDVAFRWGIGADQTDGALSMLEITIPHAMWNVGEQPARVLEVVVPGGLERYFADIEPILKQKGPDWTQRYNATAEAYGLDILDDWT